MKITSGKYYLYYTDGFDGHSFDEFDSLEEALVDTKLSWRKEGFFRLVFGKEVEIFDNEDE